MWPVDQNLFRPKDEAGVPRRFRSHGEAFGWVASSLARMYGPRLLGSYVSTVAVWPVWSVGRSVLFGAPLELVRPIGRSWSPWSWPSRWQCGSWGQD